MFNFSILKSENNLIIDLPKNLRFTLKFLINMNRVIYRALNIPNIKKITVRCPNTIDYDKMTQAYLINVLEKINNTTCNKVFINKNFKYLIRTKVQKKDGSLYHKDTNIAALIKDRNLEYYVFSGKENTEKPIEHISQLLAQSMPSFEPDKIKGFLNTTIGEIFSNSNNHSDQDKVYFISSVEIENNQDIILYVSIIDYGTTIAANVRKYFNNQNISGDKCIDWAVQPQHTTRQGSGGHGLPMLIDYLIKTKGILYIFSGDAYYAVNKDGEKYCKSIPDGVFLGTSVAFKVKLNNNAFILLCNEDNSKIDSITLDDI